MKINNHCTIEKSQIKYSDFINVEIENLISTNFFGFKEVDIKDNFKIDKCEFLKTDFTCSQFGLDSKFLDSDFNGTFLFEKVGKENKSEIEFRSCKFEKYAYFNESKIYHLKLDALKFNEIVSFQDTFFSSIKIDRVVFEKFAFFDDIEIKKINICDRRTIRSIKQQLQSADNKIDYDRFRKYELNAYKDDLVYKIEHYKDQSNSLNIRKADKKQLKSDLFILNIHSNVSDFGTNWKKAFWFIVKFGFLSYIVIYFSLNFNNTINLNLENINKFFSGLFQFYIPTNFYNPLSDKQYLDSSISWVPFVTGKILIAFGLYELIQSFRKFKK